MNTRFCSPLLASFVSLVIAGAAQLHASIDGQNELTIDFTDAKDVTGESCTRSPADMVTITAAGLGWDGEANASRDGWIQTKPLAVWAPPGAPLRRNSFARGDHARMPMPVTLGQWRRRRFRGLGEAFARYSPDGLHWSNWQVLVCDRKRTDARAFSGEITVPQRERREYGEFLSEYAKLDVPWKSDEEAAVGWILKRSPDFFGRSLPFVGYVQLLFEFPFQGGQRLMKLRASAAYGMSGVHYPPKDESVFNDRQGSPWRFKVP